MSTPELHLQTLFILDSEGRIISTREPFSTPGPKFILVRSRDAVAWAINTRIDRNLAIQLDELAASEPPLTDLRSLPVHADTYRSLVSGDVWAGPDYTFPNQSSLTVTKDVQIVDDLNRLARHFPSFRAEEIAERSPILAIVEDGNAVSICFCARRSDVAAEAGLDTAFEYRGRGYGPQVALAWAREIQASGRTPLYSTSWLNAASLAVARKLALIPYASNWSLT